MAKFEIFMQTDNQYHFHLKADNGKIILHSEGYTAKPNARNGIESVRKNAVLPERYEVLESRDGQYYFNLKAGNGEIIGTSEMYVNFNNANEGIADVTRLAPTAELYDDTVTV